MHCMACRIGAPWPVIESQPSAVKAECSNYWAFREFPRCEFSIDVLYRLIILLSIYLVCWIFWLKTVGFCYLFEIIVCFFFYSVNIAKVACSSFRFIYSKECNHLGFLGGTVVKNPPAMQGAGSIPGLGRSPGVGNGNPLRYSCLQNSMDRRAWWAIVHRVTKSWTRLPTLMMIVCYTG